MFTIVNVMYSRKRVTRTGVKDVLSSRAITLYHVGISRKITSDNRLLLHCMLVTIILVTSQVSADILLRNLMTL